MHFVRRRAVKNLSVLQLIIKKIVTFVENLSKLWNYRYVVYLGYTYQPRRRYCIYTGPRCNSAGTRMAERGPVSNTEERERERAHCTQLQTSRVAVCQPIHHT